MSSISSILVTITLTVALVSTMLFPVQSQSQSSTTTSTMYMSTTSASTMSRIVGGGESTVGEFPYFVELGGCGGALIAPTAVLFAAHCGSRKDHQIIVGSYERGSLAPPGSEERFCDEWIPHPNYNRTTRDNDFALCRLNEAVVEAGTGTVALDNTRTTTRPTTRTRLELNFEPSFPVSGDNLIVMGTGRLSDAEDAESSMILRDVTVPYIDNDECQAAYGGLTDNMLCAGFLNSGGKDACQGDSGGPIVKRVRMRSQSDNNDIDSDNDSITFIDYHVGVVSFGHGCARAGKPGVYARTSAAKTWIEGTLQAWTEKEQQQQQQQQQHDNCDGGDDSIAIRVRVTTDTYGSETRVTIRERAKDQEQEQDHAGDGDDNIVFDRQYLVSNYTNTHIVCLAKNKCYTHEITDEYGDGMCVSADACGSLEVVMSHNNDNDGVSSSSSQMMFASDGNFGESQKDNFCINQNGDTIDELPPPVPDVNGDGDGDVSTPDTNKILLVGSTPVPDTTEPLPAQQNNIHSDNNIHHSDNNIAKCQDDRTFVLDRWNRSCEWIGRFDYRRASYCADDTTYTTFEGGKTISDFCPVTCGKCSTTTTEDNNSDSDSDSDNNNAVTTSESDVDICQDNPDFRYKTTRKNCHWIREQTEKKPSICSKPSNGIKISISCPVACGTC